MEFLKNLQILIPDMKFFTKYANYVPNLFKYANFSHKLANFAVKYTHFSSKYANFAYRSSNFTFKYIIFSPKYALDWNTEMQPKIRICVMLNTVI